MGQCCMGMFRVRCVNLFHKLIETFRFQDQDGYEDNI